MLRQQTLSLCLLALTAHGVAQEPALLDPETQPRFVNLLPNPLDPGFVFAPDGQVKGVPYYEIGVFQTRQALGLFDPQTGQSLLTTVWGYGKTAASATYPGRTFVVRRDRPILVRWLNRLVVDPTQPYDPIRNPHLPHLLPIDSTIHWADPLRNGRVVGPYLGPVPVVTHLHGGHSPSLSDGLPDAWFTPDARIVGRLFNPLYTYANDQEAATLWYHDHVLGITRLNAYAGLAGYYVVRDANEDAVIAKGGLPTGPYDVPLVIQDRMFTADGELHYPSEAEEEGGAPDPSVLPEFFGDFILVNGKAWPRLDVEPREYRLRLLNGSDSRVYTMRLSGGLDFAQVATDTGLLDQPVRRKEIALAPGERIEVVVDFSGPSLRGKTIVLRNFAGAPFPHGERPDPSTTGQIMAFSVTLPLDPRWPQTQLASDLRPVHGPIPRLVPDGATRQLLLFEGTDGYGRLEARLGTTALGGLSWEYPTTELVPLGDTEVWELHNTTPDAHPIHLHLVSFQVVDRQKFVADQDPVSGALRNIRLLGPPRPAPAYELGRKDTVLALPGEVTRVVARFDRPGEFVWHCHILSHEDHEMMRRYLVVPR